MRNSPLFSIGRNFELRKSDARNTSRKSPYVIGRDQRNSIPASTSPLISERTHQRHLRKLSSEWWEAEYFTQNRNLHQHTQQVKPHAHRFCANGILKPNHFLHSIVRWTDPVDRTDWWIASTRQNWRMCVFNSVGRSDYATFSEL